jgi:hypothetical protein
MNPVNLKTLRRGDSWVFFMFISGSWCALICVQKYITKINLIWMMQLVLVIGYILKETVSYISECVLISKYDQLWKISLFNCHVRMRSSKRNQSATRINLRKTLGWSAPTVHSKKRSVLPNLCQGEEAFWIRTKLPIFSFF